MILPCIDLMDGKVVQLVQGREKALEVDDPKEMIARFEGFSQIQVIDLDAAMDRGSNARIVEALAKEALIRAGGGIRTVERARELIDFGVYRVIIGTAAFEDTGPNCKFLTALRAAVGAERITIALDSRDGQIVVKGWQQSTPWTALDLIPQLEEYCSGFLCTYVNKEGMMQGTDLGWFAKLREKTAHELIAAGGITTIDDIRSLGAMDIHCAVGMSIYTGRLQLGELRSLNIDEELK